MKHVIHIAPESLYIVRDQWYANCYCPICDSMQRFDMKVPIVRHRTIKSVLSLYLTKEFYAQRKSRYWLSRCEKCRNMYDEAKMSSPLTTLAMRFSK